MRAAAAALVGALAVVALCLFGYYVPSAITDNVAAQFLIAGGGGWIIGGIAGSIIVALLDD